MKPVEKPVMDRLMKRAGAAMPPPPDEMEPKDDRSSLKAAGGDLLAAIKANDADAFTDALDAFLTLREGETPEE